MPSLDLTRVLQMARLGQEIAQLGHLGADRWGEAAPPSGPAPLLQISPTGYDGPTLSNPLPEASGGYRTIAASDPAPHVAGIAVPGEAYVVFAARPATGSVSAAINLLSICNGGYGSGPWLRIDAFGYTNSWAASLGAAWITSGMSGAWQTVEVWTGAGVISLSVNGGAAVTGDYSVGARTTPTLYICRDEGSGGQSMQIAAVRVYDSPLDADARAAARAWAAALIPS